MMKKYDVYEKVDSKELKDIYQKGDREVFSDANMSEYKVIKILKDGRAIDVSDEGNWGFDRYLESKI